MGDLACVRVGLEFMSYAPRDWEDLPLVVRRATVAMGSGQRDFLVHLLRSWMPRARRMTGSQVARVIRKVWEQRP